MNYPIFHSAVPSRKYKPTSRTESKLTSKSKYYKSLHLSSCLRLTWHCGPLQVNNILKASPRQSRGYFAARQRKKNPPALSKPARHGSQRCVKFAVGTSSEPPPAVASQSFTHSVPKYSERRRQEKKQAKLTVTPFLRRSLLNLLCPVVQVRSRQQFTSRITAQQAK